MSEHLMNLAADLARLNAAPLAMAAPDVDIERLFEDIPPTADLARMNAGTLEVTMKEALAVVEELLQALEAVRLVLVANQETDSPLELTADAIEICESAIAKARGEVSP